MNLSKFLKEFTSKTALSVAGIVILGFALVMTVSVSQQQQNTNSKAAEPAVGDQVGTTKTLNSNTAATQQIDGLQPGAKYKIVISGAVKYDIDTPGNELNFDAMWSDASSSEPRGCYCVMGNVVSVNGWRSSLRDLVEPLSLGQIPNPNPNNHTFTFHRYPIGTATSLIFQVHDSNYSDNQGSFTVQVFLEETPPDTIAPTAPTNLNATAVSTSQINLAWTASTDNVAVTGYKIFRDGNQITTVTGTSYQNTGLTPSTTYKYTVSAYDAAGNNSGKSNEDSAKTFDATDTTPPTTPINLQATAISASQIDLAWVASTDNIAVTGYKIFRDGVQVGTKNATTYQDTGLQPNKTYTYQVSAFDAAGNNSPKSNQDSATTLSTTDTVPPTAPISLAATAVSTSQINLTWQVSTDNVGVAGYKIFRDGNELTTSTMAFYQDTGLNSNTIYKYTVSAYDGAGNNSPKSNEAQAKTHQATEPTVKLSFDLFLHGIGKGGDSVKPGEAGGGNMDPKHKIREIVITLHDSQNQLTTKTGSVTFNEQSGSFTGTVDVGSLDEGNYLIDVKFKQSLAKQIGGIQHLKPNVTTTLPQAYLVTGDINNDGAVSLNVLDYNILVNCIKNIGCSPEQKDQSDLDDNDKVDQFDFNLFIREITHVI